MALSIAERIIGDHALRAVYESGGSVLTCSDQPILEAQRLLMQQGFALGPASAASLAFLQEVASEWPPGEIWVVIGSGTAVKWGNVAANFEMPRLWGPDVADVAELGL